MSSKSEVTQDGYVWVEGHYRKAPSKESYPRNTYPLLSLKKPGEDKTKHRIRNLKKQIAELEELLED
jgi:hypothetical protein